MYSFLFDRKSLILLVAGLATVGCLLFFAGLLTGVFWGVPGAASAAPPAAPTPSAATPVAFLPSRPCPPTSRNEELTAEPGGEPVPLEAPDAEESTRIDGRQIAQFEKGPADRAPQQPAAPALDPAQAEASNLARAFAEPASAKAAPPAPAAREETALASAAPPADSRPSDSPIAGPEPIAPAKPAVLRTAFYSLQIGAFRKPENSTRIVQDLQSRGYDAYVVQEKGGRVILTVRVGRFAEREEALRAADEFRRREGKPAIVRSLSS